MSTRLNVMYQKKPCYDIIFSEDFGELLDELAPLSIENRKVCIITDSHVSSLYGDEVMELLKGKCRKHVLFSFPAGEENKTLDTVKEIYTFLIREGFDRKDLLIALGGGVVGDIAGYTAATYLRGVDFVQIPTTLLAQADSGIGGKTGVDFDGFKNMVGAFYMPKLVYMNLSLLHTLPKDQFVSGMGGILKHGLIKSKSYFLWLQQNNTKIMELQPDIIEEMIYNSCLIKRDVVERDPKENGERALLNFGHTIGHAVEKLSDFKLFHGHCVGVGMAAACRLSRDLGHISNGECENLLHTLTLFGLPIQVFELSAENILAATKSDKKMLAGKVKFILLESIGNAYINPTLTDAQILEGISSILYHPGTNTKGSGKAGEE